MMDISYMLFNKRKCKHYFFLTACMLVLVLTYRINKCETKLNVVDTNPLFSIRDHIQSKCERRLPQAILVGSQKSGTSALLHFMSYHPQIAACINPEEPRYFDDEYDNYSLEWYRNLMPCSTPDQVTFEKTPTYFYGNTTALRIKQMNDNIKILIMLKDPVEVSISMFAMWKALNMSFVLGKSFEDMVTITDNNNQIRLNTNSGIVTKATYVHHVQTWIRVFGKKQLLVLDGDSFERDPAKELRDVEKFLGIGNFYNRKQFIFNQTKNKHCIFINESSKYECLHNGKGRAHPYVSDELKTLLREYFQPYNLKLVKMLNRSFVWV